MNSYITLLGTADYLPGVLALDESLRRVGAKYPLAVALSKGVPVTVDGELKKRGIKTIRLETAAPIPQSLKELSGYWGHTFDKVSLFGLAGYEKLVYVDSDMMVVRNVDELFDRPHLSAVPAGKTLHADWIRLNSGLMVIEPRSGLDQEIFGALPVALEQAKALNQTGIGDQDLINAYAPSWPDAENLHLGEIYNMFASHVDEYIDKFEYAVDADSTAEKNNIKIIHFIGKKKPWMKGAFAVHCKEYFRTGKFKRWENQLFLDYRKLIAQSSRVDEAATMLPSSPRIA